MKHPEPHPLAAAEALMDPANAAAYLGMKPQTLAGWRCQKIGPPWVSCGRAIRYRRSDLERWINENTTTPQAS